MKKSNARYLVVVLIAVSSLGSYVYLNTVAPSTTLSTSKPTRMEAPQKEHREELKNAPDVSLPDLMLLEKVINIGKRFLPAS
ncbi:MAG TPA: hypothetical protein PKD70_00805 [Saprospiraceae bacterium]|nr:hypothetical protein [Saprospiraceae bacterium]HMP12385.1 hypothetical protein [Saprospiraceae bacterium]